MLIVILIDFFGLKIFTYSYSICIFFKELIRRSLKLEEKLNKTPSYGKHSSRSVVHFQMHIERNFSDLNSFKTINNMTHQYVFKEF